MTGLWSTAHHMFTIALRVDRRVTILTAALVVAMSVSVAATGVSQGWLIDAARLSDNVQVVIAAVLGMLAYTLTTTAARVQDNLRVDLCQRVELEISQEILAATAHVPTIDHLDRAEYLDRISLLRRGSESLATSCWSMAESAAAVVSLALSVWLLTTVHPWLALLALGSLFTLILGHRSQARVRRVSDETAEAVRLERELHELCLKPATAKELHVSGSGDLVSGRADALCRQVAGARTRALLRATGQQAVGWLVYGAGLAVALAITVRLIIDRVVTVGDLVLLVTIASQLRFQIARTVDGLSRVADAGRVTRHYLWLRDFVAAQPQGGRTAPTVLTHGITLDRISFRYPGTGRTVLDGISVHLPAASVIGLVGVNGSGKSTLVKLLTGLYPPTEGTIVVDGTPLCRIAADQWLARCSGALQDFVKFQLLARETVGVGDLPARSDLDRVADAVRRGGATATIAGLARGLNTQLGPIFEGADLSHGQWQKLALARSMMRARPLLVVFDEPTAALDPQAEHELFEHFTEQARSHIAEVGSIILLVSHRFSTLHMADHIIVLDGGRISEQGSHRELMRQAGRYAELYQAQAAGYRTTVT